MSLVEQITIDLQSTLSPNISEIFDKIIDEYTDHSKISDKEKEILEKSISELREWIFKSYKEHKDEYLEEQKDYEEELKDDEESNKESDEALKDEELP